MRLKLRAGIFILNTFIVYKLYTSGVNNQLFASRKLAQLYLLRVFVLLEHVKCVNAIKLCYESTRKSFLNALPHLDGNRTRT